MKERIKFIDIAKGLAIIYIVLGHTFVHSEHCQQFFKFLYSFHVLLFFILSGYTFNIKNKKAIKFLIDKFKRIMIPYFIWATLFLIPYFLLGSKVGDTLGTDSSFSIIEQILNVIYGNGSMSALKQNSSLWFLPALFSTEILYFFVLSFLEKSKWNKNIFLIPIIFIGYVFNRYFTFYLPWGINTSLEIGVFFFLGYLINYNNFYNKIMKKNILTKICLVFTSVTIGIFSCFFNTVIYCINYDYGNFLLMLLSGTSLSILTLYISMIIKENKILEYIGKNTMGILIFHKFIILIFQTKLGKISRLLINSNFFVEIILSLMIVVVSIAFSLLVTDITKKIMPFALGEKS